MVPDPRITVTWGGDLGSALANYAHAFVQSPDNAPDVRAQLDRFASVSDLLGDIDGINLGASYDSAKTLKQNLLTYYNQSSGRRFHLFIENSKTANLYPDLLALVPNKWPPKLTATSRSRIASHVRSFAAPTALLTYLNKLMADQQTLVVSIFELDSPEMNLVVDYFADFLEQGLSRER